MAFVPLTADQVRSPRDIAATRIAGAVSARCVNCGHAAVELPRPVRVAGLVVTHGHHAGECGAGCCSSVAPCGLVAPIECAGAGCPLPATAVGPWCPPCSTRSR